MSAIFSCSYADLISASSGDNDQDDKKRLQLCDMRLVSSERLQGSVEVEVVLHLG